MLLTKSEIAGKRKAVLRALKLWAGSRLSADEELSVVLSISVRKSAAHIVGSEDGVVISDQIPDRIFKHLLKLPPLPHGRQLEIIRAFYVNKNALESTWILAKLWR